MVEAKQPLKKKFLKSEAVQPQPLYIQNIYPKIYPKPSTMVIFWSQFIHQGLRYGTASILKNFFFRGCVASNIMDSSNISKTFLNDEVLVSIGQLGLEIWDRNSSLEAVWPKTSQTLKVYQKPSHMVKFWFQLVNWGLRYWTASIYRFKTCFSCYSEVITFFEVLISQVGKVFTIERLHYFFLAQMGCFQKQPL